LLLEELQSAVADPKALFDKGFSYFRHLYAIYLLAQFRVAAAYPPLVEFVSTPGEIVMEILDDTVTEDLGRILASLCHGDLAPIKRLIEDSEVNEWVRSASLDALIVLYAEGELEREEIIGYLGELFSVKVEKKPSYIWSAMVHIAYELYPEELMGEIKQAYREGLVDSDDISLVEIDRMMAWGKEKQLADTQRHSRGFIGNVIEEMGWWSCFGERVYEAQGLDEDSVELAHNLRFSESTPVVRQGPKVGRNEPCPCGSGKKYKKCCLGKYDLLH
jgi:hypothetical protein